MSFCFFQQGAASNIDLDDLFNDIYYEDFSTSPPGSGLPLDVDINNNSDASESDIKSAPVSSNNKPSKRNAAAADLDMETKDSNKDLSEQQQKLERRERNREHAKRSRLRKKFLLESLQEQIHGLEEQIEGFKSVIRSSLPADKASAAIKGVLGDKEKYTPLPMPSGFGPVKTIMEPDFRLSKSWSFSGWIIHSYPSNSSVLVSPNASERIVRFTAELCHFRPNASR